MFLVNICERGTYETLSHCDIVFNTILLRTWQEWEDFESMCYQNYYNMWQLFILCLQLTGTCKFTSSFKYCLYFDPKIQRLQQPHTRLQLQLQQLKQPPQWSPPRHLPPLLSWPHPVKNRHLPKIPQWR